MRLSVFGLLAASAAHAAAASSECNSWLVSYQANGVCFDDNSDAWFGTCCDQRCDRISCIRTTSLSQESGALGACVSNPWVNSSNGPDGGSHLIYACNDGVLSTTFFSDATCTESAETSTDLENALNDDVFNTCTKSDDDSIDAEDDDDGCPEGMSFHANVKCLGDDSDAWLGGCCDAACDRDVCAGSTVLVSQVWGSLDSCIDNPWIHDDPEGGTRVILTCTDGIASARFFSDATCTEETSTHVEYYLNNDAFNTCTNDDDGDGDDDGDECPAATPYHTNGKCLDDNSDAWFGNCCDAACEHSSCEGTLLVSQVWGAFGECVSNPWASQDSGGGTHVVFACSTDDGLSATFYSDASCSEETSTLIEDYLNAYAFNKCTARGGDDDDDGIDDNHSDGDDDDDDDDECPAVTPYQANALCFDDDTDAWSGTCCAEGCERDSCASTWTLSQTLGALGACVRNPWVDADPNGGTHIVFTCADGILGTTFYSDESCTEEPETDTLFEYYVTQMFNTCASTTPELTTAPTKTPEWTTAAPTAPPTTSSARFTPTPASSPAPAPTAPGAVPSAAPSSLPTAPRSPAPFSTFAPTPQRLLFSPTSTPTKAASTTGTPTTVEEPMRHHGLSSHAGASLAPIAVGAAAAGAVVAASVAAAAVWVCVTRRRAAAEAEVAARLELSARYANLGEFEDYGDDEGTELEGGAWL